MSTFKSIPITITFYINRPFNIKLSYHGAMQGELPFFINLIL